MRLNYYVNVFAAGYVYLRSSLVGGRFDTASY